MKKLILLFILFLGTQMQAQNTPLNKQQTIDYIYKLFKETYYFKDIKVDNLTVENKTLNVNFSSGEKFRFDLSNIDTLILKEEHIDNQFYIYSSLKKNPILFHIQTEEDGKRLKKALEHLIEILKTEKSTDPFEE